MSNNFNILKASSSQKLLLYDIKKPSHEVKAYRVANNNSIFTSLSEYSKIGFNYPTYNLIDPSNQFDKDKIFQSNQTLEFSLDIELNCLVPQLFFLMQFQNKTLVLINLSLILVVQHTSEKKMGSQKSRRDLFP